MVTAFYPDGAESYASVEFCGRLVRDLPVITNVDVVTTSSGNGEIYVAWGKPTELDPNQTPGPYRYVVQRASLNGVFTDANAFTNLDDTTFTDSGLNTRDSVYRYRIQFWNDLPGPIFQIGTTQTAHSIFLSVNPGDEKNRLSWSENVPWTNSSYVVYRESSPGIFDSIGITSATQYIDDSLQNGTAYCYYVKSVGAYQDTGLVDPIVNRSQQTCAVPVDNEPPCPPTIFNGPNCVALLDTISWVIIDSCASDAEFVNVYFSSASGDGTYLLLQVSSSSASPFIYSGENSIAGCYYITAVDSNGNEGLPSDTVCTGPCPLYILPNSFSPDGNGKNDIFHPIYPYRDIQRVDMRIFNRWGDPVFKTEDPEIGWNGKRDNAGPDSPEGVYFYVCKVFEIPSGPTEVAEPRTLNGFIHLIRGN
jgi:gliding motility-associated-like protein